MLALGKDLRKELDWLNAAALKNLKNYQIWHHRQTIVDNLADPTGEQEFIARMLTKDSKNYHVWSYRQWLVGRFDLWDKGEIEAVEALLREDVRNNSAWNHRWFLVFGGNSDNFSEKKVLDREMEYASHSFYMEAVHADFFLVTPKLPSSLLPKIRAHGTTFAASCAMPNCLSQHSRRSHCSMPRWISLMRSAQLTLWICLPTFIRKKAARRMRPRHWICWPRAMTLSGRTTGTTGSRS